MGKIRRNTFDFFICFTTGLLIGILIGTTIFTILISYRMDEHYKRIATLENIIQEKDTKLEKLESSINARTIVVQDIELSVTIDEEIDEMDKIVIEKAIKEKYRSIFGKEVKTIDPEILVQVVDKRIFKIDKKEYRAYVEKLILTEILKLFIKIEKKGP